eukprot:Nk52_evm6s247 gene=Nk52_evmTU6s247
MTMKLPSNLKLGFIGCGNMGSAVMAGFLTSGAVQAQNVFVAVRTVESAERLSNKYGVNTFTDVEAMCAAGGERMSYVFLCIKPYMFEGFAEQKKSKAALKGKVVVSMMAGVTLAQMEAGLPDSPCARIMPNTPCRVLKGCTTVCVNHATCPNAQDVSSFLKLLCDHIGLAVVLDEKLIDATTGMTGSGTAFVMTLIEGLADGGLLMGIPKKTAMDLACMTFLGTAELVQTQLKEKHIAEVRDNVCTPGGTTITGLMVMEDNKVRSVMGRAVEAATMKAQALGKPAVGK